ncbi:D-alanyl-D-alanine carboxypeptidase [Microbacterium sp.]|uniref:D-alanyl-D-alanine carboxypeptidase family protein n=1 Tax=Microbacterium sp. TaxID=51671 RepID=UPI0025CD6664|nr:D-alanyl-D-alanine carboxypeptidase [Microbacterium sp.]
MTVEDAPPTSRRALREQHAGPDDVTRPTGSRTALGWVDEDAVGARAVPDDLGGTTHPYRRATADLLARRPHRSPLRAGVIVPILAVIAMTGTYAGATLLWPLYALTPTVSGAPIEDLTAPGSAISWPESGSAAVAVRGIDSVAASAVDAAPMASITKLVTVLMALDEAPLALGEDGAPFSFTRSDRAEYWDYLASDESALDVPVGGTLTEYQLMQGILIGSAGNYADRLASTYWPTDAVFARAAAKWLADHGVSGITVVDPTGIDEANTATPEGLILLAGKALAHPVVADIVRTQSVTLPGAGEVVNTNDLLADPGVIGLKTGSLAGTYNLLAAKETTVGDTMIRVIAGVLGQPNDALRDSETARLLDQVLAEVAQAQTLPAGTVAGVVTTRWGSRVEILTDADVSAILWNGAAAATSTDLDLADAWTADAAVGTVTLTGPLSTRTVGVHLAGDVSEPDAWWRLTHPLQLWGLAD